MYHAFRQLSGHTLWTGPLFQKGTDLEFDIAVSTSSAHGRIISGIIRTSGRQLELLPMWTIDLVLSGISIFTNGGGLPAQLKNVMNAITGFTLLLNDRGFTLTAKLSEDSTGEGLGWAYRVPVGETFDPVTLFRPESLGSEETFSFAEAYPVVIAVERESAAA